MNYLFANTTAARVKPAGHHPIILDGDLEKSDVNEIDLEKGDVRTIPADSAVPLKAPRPKISIPHEPDESTTHHLSSTPASATPNYRRNRMILCTVLYVSFQFPTTISVCRWAWRSFTNIGDDSEEWPQLYDEENNKIAAVEMKYEQCPSDQGLQCRLQTISDEAQERARLDFVHRIVNQDKVDAAQQRRIQCRRSASSVRGMVHELVMNGDDLPFVVSDMICPADTRKTILTKAGGDTEADLMDINEYVAQYLRRADKAFDAVVDHTHDRAEYDKNYFLGQLAQMIHKIIDKINDLEVSMVANINLSKIDLRNAFQGFVVCIAPQKGRTVMCPVPSVSVRIDEIVQLLRKQFDYARMLLSIAFEVIADLVDQYNMLKVSLRSLADIFNKIREFLGVPFDAAWKQFNGPDLRRFVNLPDGRYFVPADLGSFPNFEGLPSFDPIWTFFSERANDFGKVLVAIIDRVLSALRAGLGALTNFVEDFRVQFLLLEDYDPPKFPGTNSTDIQGLKIDKKVESVAFLDGLRARTNGLRTTAALLPEPNPFVPPTSDLDLTNVTSEARSTLKDFLDVHIPLLSLIVGLWWFIEIIRKFRLFVIIDYLWALWFTFNRYFYYWKQSSIPIPEVDVEASNELPQEKEPEQVHFLKLLGLLFHDRVKIFFWLLGLGVVSYAGGICYKAYYNHYHERCVIAKIGTDLATGFVVPLVTNKALIKGDNAVEQEIKAFKDHHVSLCSKAKTDSFWMQEQQQTKLFTIANDHEQTIAEITPLLACIDFDALDGVEPGLYDELQGCMEPIDTALENGVATCNWSECEIQCGREEAKTEIQLGLVEFMCKLEYGFQSWVILNLGVLLQYWSQRATRYLLLQGFLLVFWEKLRPSSIKLKREINLAHDHAVDERRTVHVYVDDDKVEKATKVAIESHLTQMKIHGYRYFALAVICYVPWIALMIWMNITGADPLQPKWLEG